MAEIRHTRLAFIFGTLLTSFVLGNSLAAAQQPVAAPVPAAKPAAKPAAPSAAPAAPAATAQPYIRQFAKPGETIALDANQRQLVDRISLYMSTLQTLSGSFAQVAPNGN